jgi:hypothetical protein
LSDIQQGPDWWLASDGRWYPPQPPVQRPAGVSRHLTRVVQVFQWIQCAVGVICALVWVVLGLSFRKWWTMPDRFNGEGRYWLGEWVDVEDIAAAALTALVFVVIIGQIVMIVWTFQASRAAERRQPFGRSWSPGWAIGGWLVPTANIVIPKLVMSEIERIAATPLDPYGRVTPDWRTRTPSLVGRIWWIGTFASVGLITVAWSLSADWDPRGDSAGPLLADYTLATVGLLLFAACAACGARYVGRIAKCLSD